MHWNAINWSWWHDGGVKYIYIKKFLKIKKKWHGTCPTVSTINDAYEWKQDFVMLTQPSNLGYNQNTCSVIGTACKWKFITTILKHVLTKHIFCTLMKMDFGAGLRNDTKYVWRSSKMVTIKNTFKSNNIHTHLYCDKTTSNISVQSVL